MLLQNGPFSFYWIFLLVIGNYIFFIIMYCHFADATVVQRIEIGIQQRTMKYDQTLGLFLMNHSYQSDEYIPFHLRVKPNL